MWIVYVSEGPAHLVGMVVDTRDFYGMAVKLADRYNEAASRERVAPGVDRVRYSVRFEETTEVDE